MPEPNAFDPTHALDGWRLPPPAPVAALDLDTLLNPGRTEPRQLLIPAQPAGFDPTHLLDGWRPPAPAPLDLELKSLLRAGSVPDEAKMARLKARGYEMLDVEDIELAEAPPPRVVVEVRVPEVPPAPRPSSEEAMQAEAAVDLPLPDEEVWPLFREEALILDADIGMPSAAVAEPALLVEEDESLADAAAAEAPGPETAEPHPLAVDEQGFPDGGGGVAAAEPSVPEFHAFPRPTSPPTPRFVDDIQLPCAPPPAAVFEAPVLDFRAASPPPEPDPESVIAGIELPRVTPPVVVAMPELDIAALAPPSSEPDPRLRKDWQAGAWTALARQVAGASEELLQTPDGPRVQSHASQWLCAIWPPQTEGAPLARWPELASLLAAASMADAFQQLLAELPDETPLWSADLEADWDLVAELVLHQDTGLRPAQARALRELAEAERNARRARFGEAYALQGRVARRRA